VLGGDVRRGGCYTEQVGGTEIILTKDGQQDKLLKVIDPQFWAFNGHKEGVAKLPTEAVLLARSATCPVHIYKLKKNIYATQFHCELDYQGLAQRIEVYKHKGYFPPDDAEMLKNKWRGAVVTEPMKILKNFVDLYKQD
jgi:GMP synthase (glutamine-hydrolysing)